MATHLLPPPRDHDDDGLDLLLTRTAPPVVNGPEVDAQVQALLQAARPGTVTPITGGRRQKLRRRLLLGAGAVVLAASGASMAAANDDSPQSFRAETAGWTMSSVTDHMEPGRCAAVGLDLDLDTDRGGVDGPAFQAALAYLASLSVEDVDPTAEFLKKREELVTEVDADGNDLRTVPAKELYTDEQMLADAYQTTVWNMMEAHVAAQGMEVGPWSGVSVARLCQAPAGTAADSTTETGASR
ncbi:hypothetical protein SAMN06264364_12122 [Quadrisphaera granulorum]|uniref:Uncharacterized protein n=1 Tax=Quadrisphaera granulorum TaxID=317664 RepID=A0A316A0C8_9ACTN|nr:hypothetical protein [Quadrisphaera granulorum]PWJ51145.1 hypothetical protein BXY45_12122 [Quadrisphaera granulorum]SZE97795.1 hypothetical protein SAMN06264364_12122 [Quadrisphaera granulorum]